MGVTVGRAGEENVVVDPVSEFAGEGEEGERCWWDEGEVEAGESLGEGFGVGEVGDCLGLSESAAGGQREAVFGDGERVD